MTVEQYSARFMELARFAANLIPDEESKAERFENGLNPRIKERVICLEIKDYARLVEVASLAERGIRELAAAKDLKRRLKQQTSHSEKGLAIEYDSKPDADRSSLPVPRNHKPHCKKCGKPHVGECRMGSPNCFKCGKSGHFLKSCPMNPAKEPRPQRGGYQQELAQARVYSLVLDNVDKEEFADMKIDTI
jgi:ribosomal protein L37AE/L43A